MLVTKEATIGWGMGCRQRGYLILAMAVETKALCLLSVADFLKGAMRLVERKRGGAFLGSQPQEKYNKEAQQHKSAVEEPQGKRELAH